MSRGLPQWHEVLRQAGYPTTVLVIDFETYFDKGYSLSGTNALSTIEFVMDPRFEVLGCGLMAVMPALRSVPHASWVTPENVATAFAVRKKDAQDAELAQYTVIAQNARFDMTILSRRFGVYPKYVIDILGLARAWNARVRNGLEHLAARLNLPAKGKTEDFKGLAWSKGNITPEKAEALADYCRHDVELEWEAFKWLLPRLSRPAFELTLMQQTLDQFLRPVLHVDERRGEELAAKMNAEIDKACEPTGLTRKQISSKTHFKNVLCEKLEECLDDPNDYLKPDKTGKPILAIAKTDPQRADLLRHSSVEVRQLMQAKLAMSSWPLHIARVNRIIRQAQASGCGLPVPLSYHGAHTGRASGGEKINLQNLGNERSHPLIAGMREMLVAAPGEELVIVDAGQIEARGTAWGAGQWDLVGKFQANAEIYAEFATDVLGWPVRKPRKDDPPPLYKHLSWARNSIGKIGILGCGYGMGKNKAVVYAKDSITLEQADAIVTTYRQKHPKIVQWWYDLERCFRYVVRYRRPCELERGFRFSSSPDCDVILTLPSGRELHYHHARLYFERDSNRHSLEVLDMQKSVWRRIWGGAITENVVQAFCRDILMEAKMRLVAAGHRVAIDVHDELVLAVPKGNGKDVLAQTITELSRSPEWAPELPLSAEGVVKERYGGH